MMSVSPGSMKIYPAAYNALAAPAHVLAVASQPAPHCAQEIGFAWQRQAAWHTEPSVGTHHDRAAEHLKGCRFRAENAADAPACR